MLILFSLCTAVIGWNDPKNPKFIQYYDSEYYYNETQYPDFTKPYTPE